MKKEDIEKAAKEYQNTLPYCDDPKIRGMFVGGRTGFIAGAEWRINSVWHDANEKPATNKKALVKYISGDGEIKYRVDVFCGYEWKGMCHYDKLIQFAYIEDLIPNTEE